MTTDSPKSNYGGNSYNKQQLANREASHPVLTDLEKIGIRVDWISDLYTKKLNYKVAIPILLHWLPLIENIDVKETIVRALTVSWAKPVAAPLLIKEFRKAGTGYSSLKWAIGNALSVIADDSVYADVVNLVQDKRHGKAREMLVLSLGNMKEVQAVDILINLLKDDDLGGHAIMALGRIKSKKAYSEIEKFLTHPKPWIRREAKKALLKIEKLSK